MDTIVFRVIQLFGSQKRLAEVVGVTEQAVSKWKKTGVIPAERCRSIVDASNGRVSFIELRPDLFGAVPKNPPMSVERSLASAVKPVQIDWAVVPMDGGVGL